ncbi:hypothetical protein [Rhizobium giardinii]|uniref:Uncharacterized protein n=1 Tax=Rhizobium giardinii TaxID=56731 RepID=A0A7W8UA17_9HYPH|nr:hypothetical protein [Rhizobium giardinii]MBB5535600.1 hypothetical protein [Rhizobium giardinii]
MNLKDVAAQFVQDAEPISCQIDAAIGSVERGLPCLRCKSCWRRPGALAAGMNDTKIVDGLSKGRPAGASLTTAASRSFSAAAVVWHFCGCRPFGKKFLTFLDV